MPDLNVQFERAKSNVEATEADKSNAAAAHSDVRAHLEADPDTQGLRHRHRAHRQLQAPCGNPSGQGR